jgi:hypothetical protein
MHSNNQMGVVVDEVLISYLKANREAILVQGLYFAVAVVDAEGSWEVVRGSLWYLVSIIHLKP